MDTTHGSDELGLNLRKLSSHMSKCRHTFEDLSGELCKIRDRIQSDATAKLGEKNAMQKKALSMFGDPSDQSA